MDYNQIIEQLNRNKTPFNQVKYFSNQPGIYAIYFHGDSFPDDELNIKKDDLVYIGKTESSQQSRDADTHFKSGKTGSSTLRRTIGALLREELDLNPIPRNAKDFQKRRMTFYKFDEPSEAKLTSWMKKNLSLSFYEYPKSPAAIDFFETQLLNISKPVLNISKNPQNPFGSYLTSKRKECGQIAHGQSKGSQIASKAQAHEYIPTRSEEGFSPRAFYESSGSKSIHINKYKLHEAMEIVLKECRNHTATFSFLSDAIWRRDLYRQKAGGQAPASQIRLRANNYSQFDIVGGEVRLVKLY